MLSTRVVRYNGRGLENNKQISLRNKVLQEIKLISTYAKLIVYFRATSRGASGAKERGRKDNYRDNQKYTNNFVYLLIEAERFRLNSRTYQQVILVICGLVRLRIGAFQFSF